MNGLILLYLLAIAPKLLWEWIRKGKRHPGLLQRLGIQIPKANRPVIWIHAVSVGEVKAAQPLFCELRKRNKHAFFLITTTSATGHEEAKRSLSEADGFAYLPIDLTWIVKRWIHSLKPKLFILVESDFWYNLLKELKKAEVRTILVSGKISDRSAWRFSKFPSFSKKLFSCFDQICVQNEDYYRKFFSLVPDPTRIKITGNLKLDIQAQPVHLKLELPHPVITISCTHAPEEELLLNILSGGDWFIILVPRHPERFEEVAQLLMRKNIPFSRWSENKIKGKVLLVDAMGQLPICYSHSRLAIVAGSYVDHVGGHNVLEPCLYGSPVIFGPYTYGQKEFAARAIDSGAGVMLPIESLREWIDCFFKNPLLEKEMRQNGKDLVEMSRGATIKTLEQLQVTSDFLLPKEKLTSFAVLDK